MIQKTIQCFEKKLKNLKLNVKILLAGVDQYHNK